MSALPIPFNISIMQLTPTLLAFIKPVRVLDTFDGTTKNFHDDGLFSTVIFGKVGDQARNKRFSYIDVQVAVFHPIIFNALTELRSYYPEIMAGKTYARWDDEVKDFIKTDPLNGETGFAFFVQHWQKIVFDKEGSERRKNNVALVEKYKDVALNSKIVVLPAGLRDYEILDDGRESEDEFNQLYRRLLMVSSPIHPSLVTAENIKQLNAPRYGLQLIFNQLYDKLKSMLEGKHKLIMGKWATRGVFNGTRNVISTTNIRSNDLHSKAGVGANDTVMGLYQYLKAALPVCKHQIRNGFLSQVFPGQSANAVLVNKKTLKAESVKLKPYHYDAWMSDEGLDSTIALYGEEELRGEVLEVEGYYLGLIYKGKGVFKLFQDIDELPEGFDRADVKPVTFTELLYCAVYGNSDKYPCFVTRYPVTGFGSIYPSRVFLKPNMVSEVRRPLNEEWKVDDSLPTAWNFPAGGVYINAMSPSPVHLARLGADFDGDTCSANIVYSQEAIEEVDKLLNDRNYYVDTGGKISFSMATDTVNYLLKTMTGDPVEESKEEFEVNNVISVNGIMVQVGKTKLKNLDKVLVQGLISEQTDVSDLINQSESNL